MKSLKEYLLEVSILGDIDDQIEAGDATLKNSVINFLEENYDGKFIVSKKPNKDGLYEVSSDKGVVVKNRNITTLTNGLFEWTKVRNSFDCSYCSSLKSLEGTPKSVGGDFWCYHCSSLKSLEGAPKEVGGYFSCSGCDSLKFLKGAPKEVRRNFDCSHCESLTSLNGAPKTVGGNFYCSRCKSLESLEGAPKEVGEDFNCSRCKSLESLEGAPKEVGDNFYCYDCKIKFIKDDVKNISNVKGQIIV